MQRFLIVKGATWIGGSRSGQVFCDAGWVDMAIAAGPVRATESRISEAYPGPHNDDDGGEHSGDAGSVTK